MGPTGQVGPDGQQGPTGAKMKPCLCKLCLSSFQASTDQAPFLCPRHLPRCARNGIRQGIWELLARLVTQGGAARWADGDDKVQRAIQAWRVQLALPRWGLLVLRVRGAIWALLVQSGCPAGLVLLEQKVTWESLVRMDTEARQECRVSWESQEGSEWLVWKAGGEKTASLAPPVRVEDLACPGPMAYRATWVSRDLGESWAQRASRPFRALLVHQVCTRQLGPASVGGHNQRLSRAAAQTCA